MGRAGEKIPIFASDADKRTRADIRNVTLALGDDFFLADMSAVRRPGILVHGLDASAPEAGMAALMAARSTGRVSHTIVVVSGDGDADLYSDIVALGGIAGICKSPMDFDRMAKILKKCAADEGHGRRRGGGKAICVMGARGGCGTTTVALGLSWALAARAPEKVLVIDMAVPHADIPIRLDMDLAGTWNAMLPGLRGADRSLLSGYVSAYVDGSFFVLPSDETESFPLPEEASAIISLATETFDFVVVDCRMGWDDLSMKLVEACDHTLLTAAAIAPHMMDMNKCVTFFQDKTPGCMNKLHPVVNMHDGTMSKEDLEYMMKRTGKKPVAYLRRDGLAVSGSINQGKTIFQARPESPFCKDLEKIAIKLAGKGLPEEEGQGKEKRKKK